MSTVPFPKLWGHVAREENNISYLKDCEVIWLSRENDLGQFRCLYALNANSVQVVFAFSPFGVQQNKYQSNMEANLIDLHSFSPITGVVTKIKSKVS